MDLCNKTIGFIFTGVFESFPNTISKIIELKKLNAKIIPIMSFNSYNLCNSLKINTNYINEIEKYTEHKIINNIIDAKSIIKEENIDIMLIAPCSANTLAKLANGIIDTPALVSAHFHLRNEKPLVLAPDVFNGLSDNAENIGKLLNRKNYFFVPFRQNNPITKPRSISFAPEYLIKTLEYALNGEQISPILL